MTPVHSWVIGAGGLLGSALCRQIENPFVAQSVPWVNPEAASHALAESLKDFVAMAGGEPWRIIWAAGRATTSATLHDAEQELATFRGFVNALGHHSTEGNGAFTFISSAGSVYAGSSHPPFTSGTEPQPIGTYGQLKLAEEDLTHKVGESGITTIIIRLSNLYGPGQDLSKLQGIVTKLCWSAISREQVNIFVPLDTLRDYIYVDDAAKRILHWSQPRADRPQGKPEVRIVAAGQPMSLGSVLNTVEDVLHMRIPVSFGTHATASAQAIDLRLIPDTDTFVAALPSTPFPAGVRLVFQDLFLRRQHSKLVTL